MKHGSFNESIEMYLKSVSELGTGDELVAISALAAHLGVSNVSATEMVHRLRERDLLQHIPYKGVALTEAGHQRACLVIRRHRLWERFLADHLGLPWAKVHDEACRLEHATDTAVTEALAAFLGHPETCPHGNPIPSAEGYLPPPIDVPVSDMQPGQSGTITRIHPESELLLDYLSSHNICPSQPITFNEMAPFNGPLMTTIDGVSHALGHEVAAHIYVEISS